MKTLKILRVFFRLKKEELIDAKAHIWIPLVLLLFVGPLFFYKNTTWWNTEGDTLILSYFCGIIFIAMGGLCLLILWGIFELIKIFCKWILSNWRQAKEEVESEQT